MTNISKSILLASVILMALLCMIGTAAAAEEIASWSDFDKIRADLDGDFTLTANLDFNEADAEYPDGWIPLGTEDGPFTGKFDGNNGLYTISNLTLNEENYGDATGFFGFVGEGATLENITLKKVEVNIGNVDEAYDGDVNFIGLLAGVFGRGTIKNCQVDGEIKIFNDGETVGVGGLVGGNSGAITNSYTTGNITITSKDGVSLTGGLVGMNIGGAITNSYAAGNIKINSKNEVNTIGGLVGRNNGEVTGSYATGDVIIRITNEDEMEVDLRIDYIGGLVGVNENGEVTDSYVTGSIEITSEGEVNVIGGLVGYNNGVISNCYALNKEIIVNGASSEYIGKAVGYSEGEENDVYAWDGMEGDFTNDPDEAEPITSAEVWNKTNWISSGSSTTWRVNDYPDFMLPVPDEQVQPTEADASHLFSPSSSNGGGGGGSGTGSATVVNSTTNTSNPPSTDEGFGEELGNDSNETGDSGDNSNDGGDSGNDSGDSGDSSESGTNWTVIILVVAAVVVVAIAGGLYLYKTGKLKF